MVLGLKDLNLFTSPIARGICPNSCLYQKNFSISSSGKEQFKVMVSPIFALVTAKDDCKASAPKVPANLDKYSLQYYNGDI